MTSKAQQLADQLTPLLQGDEKGLPVLVLPAPSTVSNEYYSVAYYDDKSILIWDHGEGFIVLDEPRTYYRGTVEHLARCLGIFTRDRRAEMVRRTVGGITPMPQYHWIDGICWSVDGEYLGM